MTNSTPPNPTKNQHLHTATVNKNDEFYTRYEDIQTEIELYNPTLFHNHTIYCNCDNPETSNFYKFFKNNFHTLQLKKLVATHYNPTQPPTCAIYNGQTETTHTLHGDGDFASPECLNLLQEADIVATNPPFSLFRKFVNTLQTAQKKYLLISPLLALTYTNIVPLVAEQKLRVGASSIVKHATSIPFLNPATKTGTQAVASIWLTNLPHNHQAHLPLTTKYNPDLHPTYDNYNVIHIDRSINIPYDYPGFIAVPISYMIYHNPKEYKLYGTITHTYSPEFLAKIWTPTETSRNRAPILRGKNTFQRLLIQKIN